MCNKCGNSLTKAVGIGFIDDDLELLEEGRLHVTEELGRIPVILALHDDLPVVQSDAAVIVETGVPRQLGAPHQFGETLAYHDLLSEGIRVEWLGPGTSEAEVLDQFGKGVGTGVGDQGGEGRGNVGVVVVGAAGVLGEQVALAEGGRGGGRGGVAQETLVGELWDAGGEGQGEEETEDGCCCLRCLFHFRLVITCYCIVKSNFKSLLLSSFVSK